MSQTGREKRHHGGAAAAAAAGTDYRPNALLETCKSVVLAVTVALALSLVKDVVDDSRRTTVPTRRQRALAAETAAFEKELDAYYGAGPTADDSQMSRVRRKRSAEYTDTRTNLKFAADCHAELVVTYLNSLFCGKTQAWALHNGTAHQKRNELQLNGPC